MTNKIIGIMGAMPEEINSITALLTDKQETEIGGRIYYQGFINNIRTVVVFSRWGKVAAATTVTTLILEFRITELIFTGVAGAIHSSLNIGDIVVGKRFFQHDMDGRPLMERFEIPLLGVTYFESNEQNIQVAENIVMELFSRDYLGDVFNAAELDRFGIQTPKLVLGDVASGDKFFSSNDDKLALLHILPSVLCVEMEGAAVAQVCYEYQVPYTIIRAISDTADENAVLDFPSFIRDIFSKYSLEIIKLFYQQYKS